MSEPITTAAAPPPPTRADTIISDFSLLLDAAQLLGGVGGPAAIAAEKIAAMLLPSIVKAVQTHEALTGKPLDLALLHQISMVP